MVPDHEWIYKKTPQGDLKLSGFFPRTRNTVHGDPAIVFFFGGGWTKGSPTQFFPQCAHLANLGMAAFAADYRVAERHHTQPDACVEDGKSCLSWLRAHAAELGLDPSRLAAGGGSAGGHVAASTALTRGFLAGGSAAGAYRGPDALVLFNPVLSVEPETRWHERMAAFYPDISPFSRIRPGLPPMIVFHGREDTTVPVEITLAFVERSRQEGNLCELQLYDGAGHGFFNYRDGNNPFYTEIVWAMEAFLHRLGFLQEAPPA